jgi:hypothetical protein
MARASRSARSPDSVDRILIGLCVLVWLAVLGAGVAATVVLADLGAGRHRGGAGSQTPWLLYSVIAVSAVIILGAIPLLVRARQTALAEPARRPATPTASGERAAQAPRVAPVAGTEAPTEKLRVFGTIADPINREAPTYRRPASARRALPGGLSEEVVERIWLRATAGIAGAMGVAMLAVATATYLMGVEKNGAAWVAYGIAAVVTVVMPAIPWLYVRQLRATIAARLA